MSFEVEQNWKRPKQIAISHKLHINDIFKVETYHFCVIESFRFYYKHYYVLEKEISKCNNFLNALYDFNINGKEQLTILVFKLYYCIKKYYAQ